MSDRLSMVISNHWSSVSPNLEDRPVQSDYGVVKVLRLRVSARIAIWTRCVDGEDDKLSGPQDPALLELFLNCLILEGSRNTRICHTHISIWYVT